MKNKRKGFLTKKYMLVEVTMADMKKMMSKKSYGVPVYIALDDAGRCYVYPFCYQDVRK